jgi:hypothetical protein
MDVEALTHLDLQELTHTLAGLIILPEIINCTLLNYFSANIQCPRVAKKPHNLFVIKDINFYFFLDDSYASTALPSLISFFDSMLNCKSNLHRSFLLICHRF